MVFAQKCTFILCCILLTSQVFTASAKEIVDQQKTSELKKENEELKNTIDKLNDRLKRLEPENPVKMEDPPWGQASFPAKVFPISEVITKGTKIPFHIIINKPDYKRPAYEEYWRSTIGRWSYLPMRVHYALHRLFTEYDIGASNWYDFVHNIGLYVPMFQNKKALDMYIVTFQTDVTDVYTKGNQVVVVGNPKRNGVQVITITTKDVKPFNKDEQLLVQLSTPNGSEMDYSLILYVRPDFWSQQKIKLNERLRKH